MSDRSRVGPTRQRGLADDVTNRIRHAIFTGAYAPGDPLREVELSSALDVSRGPVREALGQLAREGLVHSAWHRGTVVTTLSPDDVAELDTLRGALEHLAVEQVISHATEADIANIEETVRGMERARDGHEMVHWDITFHDAVYAATHHRRLAEAWRAIRSQVHLFLLTRIGVSAERYLAHIPDEHRALVTALRTRDASAALESFAEHRRHAFDVVRNAARAAHSGDR